MWVCLLLSPLLDKEEEMNSVHVNILLAPAKGKHTLGTVSGNVNDRGVLKLRQELRKGNDQL